LNEVFRQTILIAGGEMAPEQFARAGFGLNGHVVTDFLPRDFNFLIGEKDCVIFTSPPAIRLRRSVCFFFFIGA
jgi:hypothetical protein